MFELIPRDKANHELYGARIAAVIAIAAAGAQRIPQVVQFMPAGYDLLVCSAAALASSIVAGALKEYADKRSNVKALALGMETQHSVEPADIIATAQGGLVVGAPLLAAWAIFQ
jgi:hypothetical protein